MNKTKKYLNWIIIGVIILVGALVNFFYVGSLEQKAANEHKTVDDAVRKFKARYDQKENGLMQTPTKQDQKIGGEYMDGIIKERDNVAVLLKRRASFFDEGIVKGEIVYPAGTPNAGKKVDEMTFADFLSDQYYRAMATMENAIFHKSTPVWQGMLEKSLFASSPNMKSIDEAAPKAKASAERIAAAQSRILKPAEMIPFRLDENFQGASNQQKRWDAWRRFLIFRDVVTRAVANTQVKVARDIVGFERQGRDSDILDNPKTTIMTGNADRFIQNISKIKIDLVSVGDAVIPDPEILRAAQKGETDEENETPPAEAEQPKMPENGKYSDVYKVTVELTAHLKAVRAFQAEMLKTDDVFYVPVALGVSRLTDKVTMGNFAMPSEGMLPEDVIVNEEFKSGNAVAVNPVSDYSYEPPVNAHLEFLLYRPRFVSASNPEAEAENADED
ncbi:MAG: hypothetical protein J6333_08695 [Planctomycetes bacterium]|nr:hypothetical protein [Planctomycetota bacterium]